MMSYNRVILVGNLVRDPELRTTGNGDACCEFRMAVDDSRKNRSGELIKRTLFIDVVAWGAQAQSSHQHLGQGSHILVEGRLQSEEWKTREGFNRSTIKVIANIVQFLDLRPRQEGAAYVPPSAETDSTRPASGDLSF